MRKLSLLIGLILAVGAFVAFLFMAKMTQPQTYDVVVVAREIPPYSTLTQDMFLIDTQSMSAAVADKYVSAADLPVLLAAGAVNTEVLRPGAPLLREAVAAGADAEGVSRLSVALKDPNAVIISIPVQPNTFPNVVPGDPVALFYANGTVQAQSMQTATLSGPPPTPTPAPVLSTTLVVTTEVQMPVAKWLVNGVVDRANRELRDNPNYGAPGKDTEPRYIEGDIKSIDVVVDRTSAEWIAFALANGKVQIGLLPAMNVPNIQKGDFPPSQGVTWSDFQARFFKDRGK